MNRSLYNQKTIYGSILLVVFILLFILIYVFFFKKETTPSGTVSLPATTIDSDTKRVFVKDLNMYDSLSSDDQSSIEKILYSYASQGGPDLYTGIILPESYSNTTVNNLNTVKMLIDVEPVNFTYSVTISEYNHNGFRPIEVVCAPKSQQIDQSVGCEGGTSE